MPQFIATNDFHCPHCNEMVNGASGFSIHDKPAHDSFTICVFCIELCVYVIKDGIISLRKLEEADYEYIKNNRAIANEIEALKQFVKSNPNRN